MSDPQLQTMIANLPAKTGKSLSEWHTIIRAAKLEKHGEIMKLLKNEHGVSHGFANTITTLYRQQATVGSAGDTDLIKEHFGGVKAGLRPIYDAVLVATAAFGSDVEVAPKKTYISLRRSKQFAIVQAATRSRVDLGLNLKDVAPTERLEGGNVFSGMCTHRVRLTNPSDIDDDVRAWLKQAYEQA
jgi:predicted transport protein